MLRSRLLIIADDLTGALDTGACFAAHGLGTSATWTAHPDPGGDVWVLDIETRHVDATVAGRRLVEMVAPQLRFFPHLYKKVDSTLRGNVGAELAALHGLTGRRLLLALAFPAQGRTVRGGQLLVDGRPLSHMPGSIVGALRAQCEMAIGHVPLEVVRQGVDSLASFLQARSRTLLVADAEEEADLAAIAQVAGRLGEAWLPAGSAGLAAHLATGWALPDVRSELPCARGPVLVVAGSRQPLLGAQLTALQRAVSLRRVDHLLAGPLTRSADAIEAKARRVVEALALGDALLTTWGEPHVAGSERHMTAMLGEIVRRALAQQPLGALVVTGGEVALGICQALAATGIAVGGLLFPGIPWGRLLGGVADGLLLVTKAGGFGGEDVFCRILARLRKEGN